MYKSKAFLLFGLMFCGVNICAEVTYPPTAETIETHHSTEIVKKTNVKKAVTEDVKGSISSVKTSVDNSSKKEKQKSVSEPGVFSEISSANRGSSVEQALSNTEQVFSVELNSKVDQAVLSSEEVSSAELDSNIDQAVSNSKEVSSAELDSNIDQAVSNSEVVSSAESNSNENQTVSNIEELSSVESNSNENQIVSNTEEVSSAEFDSNDDQAVSNFEPVSSVETSSSINNAVIKSGLIHSEESNGEANFKASNLNYVIIVFIIFLLLFEVINYMKFIKLLKNSNNLLELCKNNQDSINKYQEIFQNSLMNQEKDLQTIISLYAIAKENESFSSSDAHITEQHEIVKIVADRLSFMKVTMSKMDPNIKGYKQLNKSIIQITNNLQATGYEIIDYLGEDYKEGMKVVATFITDEQLDTGKRIITGVIKPQINYKGAMIQSAQITVSQN
jgi:hypothetical protein